MYRSPVRVFESIAALALTAHLAGCTNPVDSPAESTTESSAPILAGLAEPTERAVVGLLRIESDNTAVGCTGTLIAPNLVLTARHCVAIDPLEHTNVNCALTSLGPSVDPSRLFASTHATLTTNRSDYRRAAAIFVAPSNGLICGGDVALVALRESIPTSEAAPLAPAVDTTIAAGEPYAALGFGRADPTDPDTFGTRRRRDGLRVQRVGTTAPSVGVTANEWLGGPGVCEGDSGGPALDSVGRILGVGSRSTEQCAASVYESVPAFTDWLIQTARAVTQEAGLAEPSWAGGRTTTLGQAAETDGGDGGGCAVGRAAGRSGAAVGVAIGLALMVMVRRTTRRPGS